MPTATLRHSCLRLVTTLLLLGALGACGQKGPLYMPPPAPDASLTTPPNTEPEASARPQAVQPSLP